MKHLSLSESEVEKVYATYSGEGVRILVLNLDTATSMAVYLPYDQLTKLYQNMLEPADKPCDTE